MLLQKDDFREFKVTISLFIFFISILIPILVMKIIFKSFFAVNVLLHSPSFLLFLFIPLVLIITLLIHCIYYPKTMKSRMICSSILLISLFLGWLFTLGRGTYILRYTDKEVNPESSIEHPLDLGNGNFYNGLYVRRGYSNKDLNKITDYISVDKWDIDEFSINEYDVSIFDFDKDKLSVIPNSKTLLSEIVEGALIFNGKLLFIEDSYKPSDNDIREWSKNISKYIYELNRFKPTIDKYKAQRFKESAIAIYDINTGQVSIFDKTKGTLKMSSLDRGPTIGWLDENTFIYNCNLSDSETNNMYCEVDVKSGIVKLTSMTYKDVDKIFIGHMKRLTVSSTKRIYIKPLIHVWESNIMYAEYVMEDGKEKLIYLSFAKPSDSYLSKSHNVYIITQKGVIKIKNP